MNNAQLIQFIAHMNEYENDSFEQHVKWAKLTFGATITTEEATKIYVRSLFTDNLTDIKRYSRLI